MPLVAIVNSAKQRAGQGDLGPLNLNMIAGSRQHKEFPYAGVLQQRFDMQMLAGYVHVNHKLGCCLRRARQAAMAA